MNATAYDIEVAVREIADKVAALDDLELKTSKGRTALRNAKAMFFNATKCLEAMQAAELKAK